MARWDGWQAESLSTFSRSATRLRPGSTTTVERQLRCRCTSPGRRRPCSGGRTSGAEPGEPETPEAAGGDTSTGRREPAASPGSAGNAASRSVRNMWLREQPAVPERRLLPFGEVRPVSTRPSGPRSPLERFILSGCLARVKEHTGFAPGLHLEIVVLKRFPDQGPLLRYVKCRDVRH